MAKKRYGCALLCLLYERKMTQKQLAIESGVSPSLISMFVSGQRENILAKNLKSICESLDMSLNEFYYFAEKLTELINESIPQQA